MSDTPMEPPSTQSPRTATAGDGTDDDEVGQAFRTLQSAMLRANSGAAQLQQLAGGQAHIFVGLQRIEALLERLVDATEGQLETSRAQDSLLGRLVGATEGQLETSRTQEGLLGRLVRVTEGQLETSRAQESYAARMTNMQLGWSRKDGPYKIVPTTQGQDPTAPPHSLPGLWYPADLQKLSKAEAVKYLQLYGYAVDEADVALQDARDTIAAEIGMAAIEERPA